MARLRGPITAEGNKLPEGESAFNLLYATYRFQAEKRNLEFSLTKEDFARLTSGDCFYCGDAPKQTIQSKNGVYIYNGIDRLENDLGYVNHNSVSCCGPCNLMKRMMSIQDFVARCQRIVAHQEKSIDAPTSHGYCCR
jgi:hypothetical protein